MKQITTKVKLTTGAAAVTALLLTALPTAGATALDGPPNKRGVSVSSQYDFAPVRGVHYKKNYKRPIRVYLDFVGVKERRMGHEMRKFSRSVKREMQNSSHRRLVFVNKPRKADRVIRIPKRQWKRDFRAYKRYNNRYGYNGRYDRYDGYGYKDPYKVSYGYYETRRDPIVRAAHIALDIAHLIRYEKERKRRAERREDRREDRREERRRSRY